MKCPRCQHDNPAGQKFCGECGERLGSLCPSCRAPNPSDQRFCGDCGASLAPAPATGKFSSPETDTPSTSPSASSPPGARWRANASK